jgi:hypothetical protein
MEIEPQEYSPAAQETLPNCKKSETKVWGTLLRLYCTVNPWIAW